jgi:polysaccharide biosynthesis/export protein
MKKTIYLQTAILVMSYSVLGKAQESTRKDAGTETARAVVPPDVAPAAAKAPVADANYLIGPEDILTIDVWKEPGISRTVPVRRDGKISLPFSLPLLDDVKAAGLTPKELSSTIAERLRETIVNPQVTVIVSQMSSQRIYILGQVNRGGAYPLVPEMTALQALSIAGGFTPFANLKKIYVMRAENGQENIFPINYKEVISKRNPQQNIQLKAGDTIVVP